MICYTPKKNQKGRIAALFLVLFGMAFMLFGLTSGWRYGPLLQFFSLFLFVFGFEFLYRYELLSYTYAVNEESFVILRRLGKKERQVLALSMADAVSFMKTPKKKTDWQKGAVRYNFSASLRSKGLYSCFFEEGTRVYEIVFEPNEEMQVFFQRRIAENGEM